MNHKYKEQIKVDPARPQYLTDQENTRQGRVRHWITFRLPGQRRTILGPCYSKSEVDNQYEQYMDNYFKRRPRR